MLEKCVNYMVNRQLQLQTITKEDEPIYRYGYTLLLEVLINIISSMVIGCIFEDLSLMVFLLFMIIPLRSFCGGRHATKIWQCAVISNLLMVFVIIMAESVMVQFSEVFLIISDVVFMGLILCMAPVDTKTKRLEPYEAKLIKKKVAVVLAIQAFIQLLLVIGECFRYMSVLVMAHFVVLMLVCMGSLANGN